MTIVSNRPSKSKQALSVKCPKCQAKKDTPCVYIDDKFEWWWFPGGYVAVTIHLKGESFKSTYTHPERANRYKYNQMKVVREEYYKQLRKKEQRRLAITTAYNQLALQEFEQTKEWLREYGSVFWNR